MSGGMNQLFINDPDWFCQNVLVDNAAMATTLAGAQAFGRLNEAKQCLVDFKPVGGNKVEFYADTVAMGGVLNVTGDSLIRGYWCPFLAGTAAVGNVDIPRRGALHRFVFTAAMQGCFFVVTESNIPANFRVHHNQHPEHTNVTWDNMDRPSRSYISALEYTEYGDPNNGAGLTNAFNFMHRPEGGVWSYIAQCNRFAPMADAGAATRLVIQRDLGRPIINKPAGV